VLDRRAGVRDNPAKPQAGTALCRLDEVAEPGARGFVFRDGEALFKGFVVRKDGELRGYVDECPHAGWPLAGAFGSAYLTRDNRFILCGGHGALFQPDNGECVSGPCFGERLTPWPVRVEGDTIVTEDDAPFAAPPYWGGCACGAVRFEATAAPINVWVCHCRLCQKTTGQPFFARAKFDRSSVNITGETAWRASSARLRRGRCAKCGTPMFSEATDGPTIGIALGAMDDPNTLPPQMHIWVSRKVGWLKLDDGLPQVPEGAP